MSVITKLFTQNVERNLTNNGLKRCMSTQNDTQMFTSQSLNPFKHNLFPYCLQKYFFSTVLNYTILTKYDFYFFNCREHFGMKSCVPMELKNMHKNILVHMKILYGPFRHIHIIQNTIFQIHCTKMEMRTLFYTD